MSESNACEPSAYEVQPWSGVREWLAALALGSRVMVRGRVVASRHSGLFLSMVCGDELVQLLNDASSPRAIGVRHVAQMRIGDIVSVCGHVTRSKTGDLAVVPEATEHSFRAKPSWRNAFNLVNCKRQGIPNVPPRLDEQRKSIVAYLEHRGLRLIRTPDSELLVTGSALTRANQVTKAHLIVRTIPDVIEMLASCLAERPSTPVFTRLIAPQAGCGEVLVIAVPFAGDLDLESLLDGFSGSHCLPGFAWDLKPAVRGLLFSAGCVHQFDDVSIQVLTWHCGIDEWAPDGVHEGPSWSSGRYRKFTDFAAVGLPPFVLVLMMKGHANE